MTGVSDSRWVDIEQLVEAFETAQVRFGHADIASFLPRREHPFYLAALRELVRVDIEYKWERGEAESLDEYCANFPELREDRDAIAGIAFEEYRARRQAGQNPSPAEYRARFGVNTIDWPVDPIDFSEPSIGRLNGSALDVTQFGFQLVAKLGSGAFGRVYLARQGELASRFVVLKISRDAGGESRTLAQLQHTNIVPIYSLHRSGPLQAVCMPYFGATTLADVLRELRQHKSLPASGRDLLSTLDNRRSRTISTIADVPSDAASALVLEHARPPARDSERAPQASTLLEVGKSTATIEMLEELSFVEAVLWLGARLADGLAHAHERGILHRDLKPANVLLSDEGQPMLLDFNLSADTKLPAARDALVGGTLPYMAPEQMEALQGGRRPVDGRSDVYSLGVILFELLTGRLPFANENGPPESVLPRMIELRLAARRVCARGIEPCRPRWNRSSVVAWRRSPNDVISRRGSCRRTSSGNSPTCR